MIDLQTVQYEYRIALVLLNWVLCSLVGWACLCRFSSMSKGSTRRRFRVAYVALFMAATLSGFSWLWFGEWPGPGQVAMAIAWLALLGINAGNWRHGPPDYARSERDEFDSIPHDQWTAVRGRGKE